MHLMRKRISFYPSLNKTISIHLESRHIICIMRLVMEISVERERDYSMKLDPLIYSHVGLEL